MQQEHRRRVVLVGWDAADWQTIHPRMDSGLMPNLRKLVESGVMGKLATLEPALSPMLWTSIATGKTADAHGVLGFLEPDPIAVSMRPVASSTRKVKALWNILHQSGLRSCVLNWYASHPAEPIDGAYASNAFPKMAEPAGAPWPLVANSVHPPEFAATLAELRVHVGDLTGDDLLPFIPRLAEIDQVKDVRPGQLGSILAETISVHGAATWLMENREWDFFALYLDAIDRAGHYFMQYHPPRMNGVTEEDFENYKHVIDGVHCYLDAMLGRLVQLAGPNAIFLVVSDHGFQSGALRPVNPEGKPSHAALAWHRSHGLFCMSGPGIRQDELVYGAGLLDLTPTILNLFGLPAGQDMPGRTIAGAFETPPTIDRIPSWETVPGDCGRRPDTPGDVWDASEVVSQLAALGYIDTVGMDAAKGLRLLRLDRTSNLARVHLACGRAAEAIPLFEELAREQPENTTHRMYLAQAYLDAGRLDDCRRAAEGVIADAPQRPLAHLMRGNLALAEGKTEEALGYLLEAEKASEPFPRLSELIGRAYLKLALWDDAERTFRATISINADSAPAWAGLARCLMEKHDAAGAADAALEAINLRFDMPGTHYVLGVSLAHLGRLDRAAQAFENCLALAPNNEAASEQRRQLRERAPVAAGR
jgi:tetratricopeptide (TPR) repeat protein